MNVNDWKIINKSVKFLAQNFRDRNLGSKRVECNNE